MQLSLGQVHVKANFDKTYELVLSPVQAAVLLPFNDGKRRLVCTWRRAVVQIAGMVHWRHLLR